MQKLLDFAAVDVDSGRLPSCQLALARYGELLAYESFGAALPTSRYVVFSVTKGLMAALAWQVISDGLLSDRTRVAEVSPAFADKPTVTVENLLTHTAGFPRAPIRAEDGATAEGRARRFASWRLDWEPGTRTQYHTVAAHWVLADVIERVTGTDYRLAMQQRVLDPMGLEAVRLGVPQAEQGNVLPLHVVAGTPDPDMVVPVQVSPELTTMFDDPRVREIGVPGAGAVSTAADIALFYQGLLHDKVGIFDPLVLQDGTSRVRFAHLDPLTGVPANRTLGMTVAGDDGKSAMREFGKDAGPRAFGASGLGGQVAWADPDSGLSVCYLTNGMETDLITSFIRSNRVSTLAARCRNVP